MSGFSKSSGELFDCTMRCRKDGKAELVMYFQTSEGRESMFQILSLIGLSPEKIGHGTDLLLSPVPKGCSISFGQFITDEAKLQFETEHLTLSINNHETMEVSSISSEKGNEIAEAIGEMRMLGDIPRVIMEW